MTWLLKRINGPASENPSAVNVLIPQLKRHHNKCKSRKMPP